MKAKLFCLLLGMNLSVFALIIQAQTDSKCFGYIDRDSEVRESWRDLDLDKLKIKHNQDPRRPRTTLVIDNREYSQWWIDGSYADDIDDFLNDIWRKECLFVNVQIIHYRWKTTGSVGFCFECSVYKKNLAVLTQNQINNNYNENSKSHSTSQQRNPNNQPQQQSSNTKQPVAIELIYIKEDFCKGWDNATTTCAILVNKSREKVIVATVKITSQEVGSSYINTRYEEFEMKPGTEKNLGQMRYHSQWTATQSTQCGYKITGAYFK